MTRMTWWERNQTANTPVARISTDNGETFGPTLNLATNGTLGEAPEEEEGLLFAIYVSPSSSLNYYFGKRIQGKSQS